MKIKFFILVSFIISSLYSEDRIFEMKDYVDNGSIDALIDKQDDTIYLVQLDIKNDSLLNLVNYTIPNLELHGGPASYHRLLNDNHIQILQNSLSEDYYKILDDNYSNDLSRNYWSLTLQGNQYYSTGGETNDSCMCIDGSDCIVVGYNDSWYNPFDYSGEASWNFIPPYFDEVTEARVYLTGVQCDSFPLSSETILSLKNNNCDSGNFQVTLSENYTTNGPYVLTGDILNDIWCQGALQPLVQSEDNYNVDWIRIELYYSCNTPDTPTQFSASDQSSCDYVEISWDAIDQAESYLLYRDDQLIANLDYEQTSFLDYNAEEELEYTYCIKSQNMCGESDASCNYGSLKPNADVIDNIYVSNQFTEYIEISWDSVQDVNFYNLFRDSFLLNVIPAGSDLVYVDQFVDQNTSYEYCIEANNECGASSWTCDLGQLAIADQGDINIDGSIDVLDIVLVVNYILEIQEFDEVQLLLSDLNNDQLINILDIVLLANFILG